tara:strand:- start:1773 stop:2081 length:309 start_codon:yes stop_codon:yes gene_type:complete
MVSTWHLKSIGPLALDKKTLQWVCVEDVANGKKCLCICPVCEEDARPTPWPSAAALRCVSQESKSGLYGCARPLEKKAALTLSLPYWIDKYISVQSERILKR